jgi:hypothetical protein
MKKLIIGIVSVAVLTLGLVPAEAATDPRAHKKNTTLRPPCAPECELDANHSKMLKVRRIIALEAVLKPIGVTHPVPGLREARRGWQEYTVAKCRRAYPLNVSTRTGTNLVSRQDLAKPRG